jgi:hypothetical protein
VIVVITIIILGVILSRTYRVPFFFVDAFGISFSAVHWIGWIGALYIAITVPVYSVVKRRYPHYARRMLNIHIIGNLLAMMLVSIHFANQVTRSAIDFGTGTLLYISLILLVTTGMALMTGALKKYIRQVRFIHPASAIAFYLLLLVHIILNF